jgi:hypothetical protein
LTANLVDVDKGLAHRLAVLAEFAQWQVAVGVLEDGKASDPKKQDPELTVLFVASIHEFGAPSAEPPIPERSFVRAYVDEHEAQIRGWQKALAHRAFRGETTAKQALDQLGAAVAGGMQARIAAGIAPPNAQATIERKGSSTPLVDKGQLRASITWHVRKAT